MAVCIYLQVIWDLGLVKGFILIPYHLKYRWGLGSLHLAALTTLKLKQDTLYLLGLGKDYG